MLVFFIALLFAIPTGITEQFSGKNQNLEAFPPTPFGNPWDSKRCGRYCQAAAVTAGVTTLAGVYYAVRHPEQAKAFFKGAPAYIKKQVIRAVDSIKGAKNYVASKLSKSKPVVENAVKVAL